MALSLSSGISDLIAHARSKSRGIMLDVCGWRINPVPVMHVGARGDQPVSALRWPAKVAVRLSSVALPLAAVAVDGRPMMPASA